MWSTLSERLLKGAEKGRHYQYDTLAVLDTEWGFLFVEGILLDHASQALEEG